MYQSIGYIDNHTKLYNNIKVCTGSYSGSDSNYQTYKSNCHQLMSDKCSLTWDQDCSLYQKQLNHNESNLFLKTVSNQN